MGDLRVEAGDVNNKHQRRDWRPLGSPRQGGTPWGTPGIGSGTTCQKERTWSMT